MPQKDLVPQLVPQPHVPKGPCCHVTCLGAEQEVHWWSVGRHKAILLGELLKLWSWLLRQYEATGPRTPWPQAQ